ncbi:hypothetical protein [Nostoc sp.]|uniref:hypothetical protein n=1 Tax=Nostoc sp. TaxID=1180 RepID=UPI002FFA7BF5
MRYKSYCSDRLIHILIQQRPFKYAMSATSRYASTLLEHYPNNASLCAEFLSLAEAAVFLQESS